MINLLLVSPRAENSQGGMVTWTVRFLKAVAGSEIKCDLLNIATIGCRAEQGNAKRNFSDELVRTKRIFRDLKQLLLSKKYDVAHINTSCGTFGLLRDYITAYKINKKQPECKIIVHFHCDVEFQAGRGYKRFFLKKFLSLADSAFVLNEQNRRFLENGFSASCFVVPNFIDDSWIRADEKSVSENVKHVVFVGFVQPEKGALEIYEIAKMFPDMIFELIGEVRDDVSKWKKPQNIILCGKRNHAEIMNALDSADVFLFPTHTEGFSIALLESMSRGLPCITTPVGANAEMLEERGGVIVPVGDIQAIKKAFEAIEDRQKRREMSRWNINKVQSFYSASGIVEKIITAYKK